jgi:hypothetical protein
MAEDAQYFRGVEVQQRGAIHDHAMIRTKVELEERAIRTLAMAAGFGHSVKLVPVEPGSTREAYYVSKYITKAADSRSAVPWMADVVDEDSGEVTRELVDGRYRTWSMSREWGLRMADVVADAAAWVAQRRETEALAALWAGFGDGLVLIPSAVVPPDG